ncbi:MAG: glycosyltransferase [Clostridiaceae bacterium]|nr:glycosyltransferase [Clostridiaceae bacterium]
MNNGIKTEQTNNTDISPPKLTVIIPAYNAESTIARCINSILAQTFKDIEIIIIDDASTDGTDRILELFSERHKQIKVITIEHSGQGIARNEGLKAAQGEYIGFVDADDTIDKNMYSDMLKLITQHNADVVQCNIINVLGEGKYAPRLLNLNKVVRVKNKKNYFNTYLFGAKHSFECCNKVFNKAFLQNNNIWFKSNDIVFSEDLLFNLEVAAKLRIIVFTQQPYYFYFNSKKSHSKTNNIKKIKKLCVLFDCFYRQERELKFECSKLAVLIIMINLSHLLAEPDNQKDVIKILRQSDIKKYLFLSFIKMIKIRHKILMLLLLCMPMRIKLLTIRLYYTKF